MSTLETIGYGIAIWCGLVALVIARASYVAYRRDHAQLMRRAEAPAKPTLEERLRLSGGA